jgi:hypothetical protein
MAEAHSQSIAGKTGANSSENLDNQKKMDTLIQSAFTFKLIPRYKKGVRENRASSGKQAKINQDLLSL